MPSFLVYYYEINKKGVFAYKKIIAFVTVIFLISSIFGTAYAEEDVAEEIVEEKGGYPPTVIMPK